MDEVTVDFSVQNSGDKKAIFLSCKTECGCVENDTEYPYTIDPGGRGEGKLHIHLGGRQGLYKNKIEARFSYDHLSIIKSFTITTKVPKIYSIEPTMVVWDGLETANEKIVHIHLMDKYSLHIISVNEACDEANKQFDTITKVNEDGKDYDIIITPRNPKKTNVSALYVATDFELPRLRVIRIPVVTIENNKYRQQ